MVSVFGLEESGDQGRVASLAVAQQIPSYEDTVDFAREIHQACFDHSGSQESRDLGLAGRTSKIGHDLEEHPNGPVALFVDLVHCDRLSHQFVFTMEIDLVVREQGLVSSQRRWDRHLAVVESAVQVRHPTEGVQGVLLAHSP